LLTRRDQIKAEILAGENTRMRCMRCGMCCHETEMLVTQDDIRRIERLGFEKQRFVRMGSSGYFMLKNNHKHCVFFDAEKKECKVYDARPEGCRVYPVLFDDSFGIVVDELCRAKCTIGAQEQAETGLKLKSLLDRIDKEARKRVKKKSM
jgi:Fe-S-cluster containining protein